VSKISPMPEFSTIAASSAGSAWSGADGARNGVGTLSTPIISGDVA
jgi:hypothetical protein